MTAAGSATKDISNIRTSIGATTAHNPETKSRSLTNQSADLLASISGDDIIAKHNTTLSPMENCFRVLSTAWITIVYQVTRPKFAGK